MTIPFGWAASLRREQPSLRGRLFHVSFMSKLIHVPHSSHPLDVAKIRLQTGGKQMNMFTSLAKSIRAEGESARLLVSPKTDLIR